MQGFVPVTDDAGVQIVYTAGADPIAAARLHVFLQNGNPNDAAAVQTIVNRIVAAAGTSGWRRSVRITSSPKPASELINEPTSFAAPTSVTATAAPNTYWNQSLTSAAVGGCVGIAVAAVAYRVRRLGWVGVVGSYHHIRYVNIALLASCLTLRTCLLPAPEL